MGTSIPCEQVRQLASEENLINNATQYNRNNAAWGTIHDYGNITLSEDTLVLFTFTIGLVQSCYRLKIGSFYAHGGSLGAGVYTGLAFVAAGTHDVLMEQKNKGGDTGRISDFQLGKAKFSDTAKSALAVYAAEIDLTVAQRSHPAGTLKNAVFAVMAWAYTPAAQTNFENVGDALTNGVQLTVDGAQVDWATPRYQDSGSEETASAIYYASLSVGVEHSFVIGRDNANTVVHISIIGCPWILMAADNEPVTLDLPQGSTFYLVLEPLEADPAKNSKIGKIRAVTFGDATDFYSTATGTGILSHTYTFEFVDPSAVRVLVNGLGGCISLIGLDDR